MPLIFPHDGILTRRPDEFDLNTDNSLATGLKFADLGRFTGSRLCYDSSLYQNNGTLSVSMDAATDWVFDAELGCNGVSVLDSEYITLPKSNRNFGISTAGTWAAHIRWSADVPFGHIFYDYISYKGMTLRVESGGALVGYIYPNDHRVTASSVITPGVLYHVAFSFSSAGYARLYLDGKEVGTPSEMSGDTLGVGLSPLRVARWIDSQPERGFAGLLANATIHDRALSLPEIQTLADRSDPMLGGLIQPLVPRYFPVAVAAGGTPSGYADVSATASIAAFGTTDPAGYANVSATATIAAFGTTDPAGSADVAATTAITAFGTISPAGSADVSATSAIAAYGTITPAGSADVAATATIAAFGTAPAENPTGYADVSATATIAAYGTTDPAGYADVSATATITAVGTNGSAATYSPMMFMAF